MLLWVIFALMTAAALAGLLWPFYRRDAPQAGSREAELAVYRDQLAEVGRDLARGMIDTREADAARNEVSRRMLAAAGSGPVGAAGSSPRARRAVVVTALVGIPAMALSTYLASGRPDLPGLPQAERMATALERADYAAMIAQVEAHLADNPSDSQGWLVLAPAYRGMGRYRDAAQAYAHALESLPATPELLADMGEMLVLADEGVVTENARAAFRQALAMDPGSAKSRFYSALADRQDGKRDEAMATWRAMLDDAPADAPWRPAVERQLASLEAQPGGERQIGEAEVAKAQDLQAEDRDGMIRGMVDGLARRLAEDGGDLQEWLRLAQARVVLGEREAAVAALRSAEAAFDDEESIARIAEARSALGLDGEAP